MPYEYEGLGFTTGETVRVTNTGATGEVTYPGPRGVPDRVYVHFEKDTGPKHMRSLTFHYHYSELEHFDPDLCEICQDRPALDEGSYSGLCQEHAYDTFKDDEGDRIRDERGW